MMKSPILSLAGIAFLLVHPVSALDTDSFYLKAALVHHVKPSDVTQPYPVIMVPGHNLSSYIYLTTPDGREGWAQQFATAGYEVFVINDPKLDFSHGFYLEGFSEVPTEGAPPANPDATQAWSKDIWRRWGFGTSEGNPYPDTQFPTESFDSFAESYPWLSSGSSHSFSDAISALLSQAGPAILLAHSAGGPQAVTAAKNHPELTAGIVLVEPTGPPTESDFPALQGISMLGVYGDYIDSRNQGSRKTATIAAAALFETNGGSGQIIDLPEDYGVNGNSHLLMQARNNAFISDLILEWAANHTAAPGDPGPGSGGNTGGKKGGRGDAMIDRIFSQLDTDDDGVLTREEFAQGRRYRNADASVVNEAFALADSNGDGEVTSDEMGTTDGGGKGRFRGKGGKGS